MIQSVARALTLLEELDKAGTEGASLTTLAGRVHLKVPTAHNLLRTLACLHYVSQRPGNRRYLLGKKSLQLGRQRSLEEALARAAAGVVDELNRSVNETVVLAVYRDAWRQTVLTAESQHALRVGVPQGADRRLYDTATGRVLLSRLSEGELGRVFAAIGLPGAAWPEARTQAELIDRLGAIREAAVAFFERVEGGHIRAVAVPLGSATVRGGLNAALGVFARLHAPRRSESDA